MVIKLDSIDSIHTMTLVMPPRPRTSDTTKKKDEPARIVKVVPSNIKADEFSGKLYDHGNYVVAREDKSDREHVLMNGSMNGVPEHKRIVGKRGWIRWVQITSCNFPTFITEQ